MKRVFVGTFGVIFVLGVLYLLFENVFSTPQIQIKNEARAYLVSYHPTSKFTDFLKDLKQDRSKQDNPFANSKIKIIFVDTPFQQLPPSVVSGNQISARITKESKNIYSIKIFFSPNILKNKKPEELENVILYLVIQKLISLQYQELQQEQLVKRIRKEYTRLYSQANPFTIALK
jgi:hypothetical protein